MTDAEVLVRRLRTLAGMVEKVQDTGAILSAEDAKLLHQELVGCADAVRGLAVSVAPCLPPALSFAVAVTPGGAR